jgi:hypothetical protein
MSPSEKREVPAREIVQIKLFHLPSKVCDCGKPIEVVILSMTNTSEAIISAHCSDCSAEVVDQLGREGFHNGRDGGESLFNADYVPEPETAAEPEPEPEPTPAPAPSGGSAAPELSPEQIATFPDWIKRGLGKM